MQPPRMARALASRALALLIGLIGIEAEACLVYRLWAGQSLDRSRLQQTRIGLATGAGAWTAPTAWRDESLSRPDQLVIHPYLGYVAAPLPGLPVTSEGMWTSDPGFDYAGSRAPVTIGVFGGAAARAIGHAPESLLAPLRRVPALRGKDLRVVCPALAITKQPQAANALAYLLLVGYHFDVIVNLDGINELALAAENQARGQDPLHPFLWEQLAVPPLVETSSIGRFQALQAARAGLARRVAASCLARSLTVNVLWSLVDHNLATAQAELGSQPGVAALEARPAAMSANPASGPDESNRLLGQLVSAWAEASVQMSVLAQDHAAAYLHLLEPQPAAGRAAPGSDPTANWLPAAYPRLRDAGDRLQRAGVDFVDLSQLELPTNDPGQRTAALAARVAAEIGRVVRSPAEEPRIR